MKAYYGLLWAERYRTLVAETQEQKKRHAEMARTRFQNGVATEVDVLRSEVAVANGARTWCGRTTPSGRRARC